MTVGALEQNNILLLYHRKILRRIQWQRLR